MMTFTLLLLEKRPKLKCESNYEKYILSYLKFN